MLLNLRLFPGFNNTSQVCMCIAFYSPKHHDQKARRPQNIKKLVFAKVEKYNTPRSLCILREVDDVRGLETFP